MHCLQPLEGRKLFASYAAATVTELVVAMRQANSSAVADTIALATGATFMLNAVDNTPAAGANGLPMITAAGGGLTILGNGGTVERTTALGTPAFRLFCVDAGASLTLRDLTVRGGRAENWYGTLTQGGGIYSQGSLGLSNVIVENNVARGASGQWTFPGSAAEGGGIYSGGTLDVANCVIRNNAAIGGDGQPAFTYGDGVRFPATAGGNGYGGGICVAAGTASIRRTTITSNVAQGGRGGSTSKKPNPAGPGAGVGGGIYIGPAAPAGLDAFTVRNTKGNSADSSREIFGRYTRIV
jgi:hypothetical protein